MNMKNNFSQAVKELLEGKNDDPVIAGESQPEKPAAAPEKIAETPPVRTAPAPHPQAVQPPVKPAVSAPAAAPIPAPARPIPPAAVSAVNAGPTIIAQGTTIIGEIRASGDVEMMGSLKGNLEGQENLKLCGKIIGNVKGKQIELLHSAVQGDIFATADVVVDGTSVVVGNINANSIVLGGKVKGNIVVNTTATFSENALLLGNVQASQLSVNSGAKLEGEISIKREKEDEHVFEEEISI